MQSSEAFLLRRNAVLGAEAYSSFVGAGLVSCPAYYPASQGEICAMQSLKSNFHERPRTGHLVRPNPSIERTSASRLRRLAAAAHVER